MVSNDHARRKVAFVLRLRLTRHLPPAIVLAQNLRVAAPIDDTVPHDANVLSVVDADKWSTPTARRRRPLRRGKSRWRRTPCNGAAQPGSRIGGLYLIKRRIARPKQRHAFVDQ